MDNSTIGSGYRAFLNASKNYAEWFADQPFSLEINDSGTGYKLKAKDNPQTFNIVEKHKWTYSKYLDEVPRVVFIEKQIQNNQQLDFYKNRIRKLGSSPFGNNFDPYAALYEASSTNFQYVFPFIVSTSVQTTNKWSSSLPGSANLYSGVASGVAKEFGYDFNVKELGDKLTAFQALFKNDPYVGIEQPMYFSGPERNTFKIKFPLFNTGTLKEVQDNYNFIRVFAFQNLIDRKTQVTYDPPVIYEVQPAQGHIGALGYRPAVYVSDFVVKNVGAVRSIDIGIQSTNTKVLIPEAYLIEITCNDLIANSRQIFSSFFTGTGVVSTDSIPFTDEAASNALDNARSVNLLNSLILNPGAPGSNSLVPF